MRDSQAARRVRIALLVASACTAFSVFVATTFLHELAHAAVLLVQGADSVTIHQGATMPHGLGRQGAAALFAVLLAGPLVTMLQGVGALFALRRLGTSDSSWRIDWLWIGFVGLAYVGVALAIATWPGSDVGRMLGASDAPGWVALVLAPIGFALLVLGVGPWCAHVAREVAGDDARVVLPAAWAVVVAAQLVGIGHVRAGAVAMMALPMVQLFRPGADPVPARMRALGRKELAVSVIVFGLAILGSLGLDRGLTIG
jgi:hypothetical protein